MHHARVIVIIVVCLAIVGGVFVIFKKANQPRDYYSIENNFEIKAIEQYWNNKDLFEGAKECFISIPDDINIYRDNNNILVKDRLYEDAIIDEDFERILLSLFEKFNLMDTIYYWADDKVIKFELSGAIKPKGIVYIECSNEEEVKNKLALTKCQYLEENWYYYEQPAGV